MVAIAGGTGDYTITFGAGFTLNTDLLAVNLGTGGSLTLQGAGSLGPENPSVQSSQTCG